MNSFSVNAAIIAATGIYCVFFLLSFNLAMRKKVLSNKLYLVAMTLSPIAFVLVLLAKENTDETWVVKVSPLLIIIHVLLVAVVVVEVRISAFGWFR